MSTSYEDLSVGDTLSPTTWGPLRSAHLMRWSSAVENWHRVHYDAPFAKEHDLLPDILVSGSMKRELFIEYARRTLGPGTWLWFVEIQFRAMDVAGDTLTAGGEIAELRRYDDFGVAQASIEIRNGRGEVSSVGTARIAVPYAGGQAIPYPFPRDLAWRDR